MSFELQVVFKTTLILVSAGVLSLLFRHASAALRHAIWVFALLAVLTFPLASVVLPPVELPILPATVPPAEVAIQSPVVEGAIPIIVPAVSETAKHDSEPPAMPLAKAMAQPWAWRQWLTISWAAGALIVVGGWLRAVLELRRLKRTSALVNGQDWTGLLLEVQRELAVGSRVQLRIASEPVPPMTWGVFRHVILLPSSANEWIPSRRRLVLEHEMAHVKRRDGLGQLLSQVVWSLYWFNPVVWYAIRRLRAECEHACDDAVLRLGVEAADYAEHLVDIARGLNSGFARTAISMANPSQLKSRVLAILDVGTRRRRLSHRACAAFGVAGVLMLSAAVVRVTAVASIALPAFPMPFSSAVPMPEPQAAPPQIIPLPAGDLSIEGRILTLGTNDPVPGARVALNTDPVSESASFMMADENGRFEFKKVAPGKYQLLATADGYVRGVYGQRHPNGPGVTLTLEVGQRLNAIALTLTPMGAISGKIRNRFGEPAANVTVRALRIVYQDGHRTLLPLQTARTNDLGEYRLYYLEPGPYVVSALPPEGPIPVAGTNMQLARLVVLPGSAVGTAAPTTIITSAANLASQGLVSSGETGETYVPLYFPGVPDVAGATPIDLKPGATYNSADFVVSEVRAARILGQIRDITGQPVKGTAVVLSPQGDVPVAFDRYGAARDDGSLEFRGIPPGAYDLIASSGNLPTAVPFTIPAGAGGALLDRGPAAAAPVGANDTRLMARVSVRVGSTDVENVSLTLRPGFRINGKLTIEAPSTAEAQAMMAGLAVQLIPAAPLPNDNDSNAVGLRRSRFFSMPGAVESGGTFTITGAFPGVYRIAVRGASKLPPGAYVKSARIENADVLSPRFTLDSEPRGELEIVIGAATGTLQIAVVDETKAPAKAATVALVPDAGRSQHYELYFKTVTDRTGKARLENIPPGNYQAYAWNNVDDGAWWDPEFLRKYQGQGKPVQIVGGGMHNVELKSTR